VIALLLIDDGRADYRARCLESASVLLPPVDLCIEVSDPDHELGFAGAIQAGWDAVLESGADYVFHLEADFTFNVHVPLQQMIEILGREPKLAQVALKRQPWNASERLAGGIVEQHPDHYIERHRRYGTFTEHARFFTTNPSVYSAELCKRGWPQVPESEGIFTHQLRDDGLTFAFWGGKFQAPTVTHIGQHRAGKGY